MLSCWGLCMCKLEQASHMGACRRRSAGMTAGNSRLGAAYTEVLTASVTASCALASAIMYR